MGGLGQAPLGDDPLLALGWKSNHHKRDLTFRDAAPRSAAAAGARRVGGSAEEAAAAQAMNNGATFAASMDAVSEWAHGASTRKRSRCDFCPKIAESLDQDLS